jgi:hypothetical protein
MNRFGYRESMNNGLSFELLIDGDFIGLLVGGEKGGIPYWAVGEDLPTPGVEESGRRVVSVCGCGEYGCGNTSCLGEVGGDLVRLHSFGGVVSKPHAVYSVGAEEYRGVIAEIVAKAKARRNQD